MKASIIRVKPSQSSHPSHSGSEPACEGFYDGLVDDENLHGILKLFVKVLREVKALPGINREKGYCLMAVIV